MERAIVVRGRLQDARHIELDEAVEELSGRVEVVLRPVPAPAKSPQANVLDFIARLPPGSRSKDDIDAQIQSEREAWGER